jgi:adenylate kinase
MIVALTGTPGTGKSEVAEILKKRYRVESVSELAKKFDCILGEEEGSKIVDIEKLAEKIDFGDELVILEGHLSHYLNPDIVIVLRCNPLMLKKRLEERGWSKEKALENVEAEIVDAILVEALGCKVCKVYEVDTTSMKSEEVANAVEQVLKGKCESFKPGRVDWIREVSDRIEGLMRKC